jgi:hypothetical protein
MKIGSINTSEFRRSPSSMPKQIKKCQKRGFKFYFIPYLAADNRQERAAELGNSVVEWW